MLDVKDIRIGLYNFIVIGLMALLFIVLMKLVTAKFPIPGFSEVVQAA